MRFAIAAIAAVVAASANAQNVVRVCATPEPSTAEVLRTTQEARPFAERSVYFRVERVQFVIPIAFHVIHAGGTGTVSDSQINAQLRVLNEKLGPLGYHFIRHSVTRTDNPLWHTMLWGEESEFQAKLALSVDHTQALNFYIASPRYRDKNGVVQSALGLASFPWWLDQQDWWDSRRDGVIVDYTTLPGAAPGIFDLGHTAVHEVGHWIGLLHTFQGGGQLAQGDPDGCVVPGDEVPDTGYERGPYFGPGEGFACEALSRNTCPDADLDPIRNYMDYADDRCMSEWTPGQDYRARGQMQRYRREFVERSPDVRRFLENHNLR
jgi:hypothetical protein